MLIAVLLWGEVRGGTRGWFAIGSLTMQPSEFARLGVALLVATCNSAAEWGAGAAATVTGSTAAEGTAGALPAYTDPLARTATERTMSLDVT